MRRSSSSQLPNLKGLPIASLQKNWDFRCRHRSHTANHNYFVESSSNRILSSFVFFHHILACEWWEVLFLFDERSNSTITARMLVQISSLMLSSFINNWTHLIYVLEVEEIWKIIILIIVAKCFKFHKVKYII